MELKWVVFLVMAWVVLSLLLGVAEGAIIGGAVNPETGEPEALSTIRQLQTGDFFQRANAFVNLITFNFPELFRDGWEVLHWIFFLPFVIAFGVMGLGYILAHIPVIGRGS